MAFVQYCNEMISRDAFRRIALTEYRNADDEIDNLDDRHTVGALAPSEFRALLNEARDIMAAARWCLEWTDGLHDGSSMSWPEAQ